MVAKNYTNPSNLTQPSSVGMSIETVFVQHYLVALDRLQLTWLDGNITDNKNAFALQLEYLIRLVPDRVVQKRIRQEYADVLKTYNKNIDTWAQQKAGLTVVTSLIEFLTRSFDLLHEDIFGPGTNSQYADVIEIPDIPQVDVVKSSDTEITEALTDATG